MKEMKSKINFVTIFAVAESTETAPLMTILLAASVAVFLVLVAAAGLVWWQSKKNQTQIIGPGKTAWWTKKRIYWTKIQISPKRWYLHALCRTIVSARINNFRWCETTMFHGNYAKNFTFVHMISFPYKPGTHDIKASKYQMLLHTRTTRAATSWNFGGWG